MSTRRVSFFGDAGPEAGAPVRRPERRHFVVPPGRPARVVALAAVLAVAVVVGVADRGIHRAVAASTPPLEVATVPPPNVESSAWYCVGGTAASGSAASSVLALVNTTSQPVTGTVSVVAFAKATSTDGRTVSSPVLVPPHAQILETPGAQVRGDFVAATVALRGGGVLVSESVAGPLGWSEAPCSRTTSASWFFASGATTNAGTLALSLYNPTTTEAVVDTSFVTPSGVVQPQPFEGIVVAPGALVVEPVDAYVQDARSVSSIVSARTGTVVAAELETQSKSGSHGISLRIGVPAPQASWVLPRTIDVQRGTTTISVLNPSTKPTRVAIVVRSGTAPPARFVHVIGSLGAWAFAISAETRIPVGLPYLATVRVVRGPRVVVDRTVTAPGSGAAGVPQFGASPALGLGTGLAVSTAVLPGPGTPQHPRVTGAVVDALNLVNTGPARRHVTVWVLRANAGMVKVASSSVAPGSAISIGQQALDRFGPLPLVVFADGPIGVAEDLAPSVAAGVVSLAGAGSTP